MDSLGRQAPGELDDAARGVAVGHGGGLGVALWKNRRLCPDLMLRAFGVEYPVHRVILAAQSEWFRRALIDWASYGSATPNGSSLPTHGLILGEDVTQRGFEWILDYLYGSPDLHINSANAFDVLGAAHYLGCTEVQDHCVTFLCQHLNPANFAACLAWATHADHGEVSEQLAAACRMLLALRLPQELATWAPALAHVDDRTLHDILSCDHLAVQSEYERYGVVARVAELLLRSAERSGEATATAAAARAPVLGSPVRGAGSDGDGAAYDGSDRSSGGEGAVDAAAGDAQQGPEGDAAAATPPASRDGDNGSCSCSSCGHLQRMLSDVLHLPGGGGEALGTGAARHLRLARSCPAAFPCATPPATPLSPPGTAAAPARSVSRVSSACGSLASGTAGGSGSSRRTSATASGSSSRSLGAAAWGPRVLGGAEGEGDGPCHDGVCDVPLSPVSVPCTPVTSAQPRLTAAGGAREGGLGTERLPPGCEPCGDAAAAASPLQQPPHPLRHEQQQQPQHHARQQQRSARSSIGDLQRRASCDSDTSSAAACASALSACARWLLCDAVRYEHLGVAQLLEVRAGGRVPAHVLHAALWRRTQLEHRVREEAGAQAAAAQDGDAAGGALAAGSSAAAVPRSVVEVVEPDAPRPFRMCWRLPCGALKKLCAGGAMQSPLHQYAGAVWQVRCAVQVGGRGRSSGGGSGGRPGLEGQLGLFVGRTHPPAPATPAASRPGGRRNQNLAPQQRPHHRHQHGQGQQQQQHVRGSAQQAASTHAAEAPDADPWVAECNASAVQPPLRCRYRIAVYQSDNTALGGRLCLADTGHAEERFAAGAFWGSSGLLSRADLARLADDAPVLVFVTLEALLGGAAATAATA